MLPTPKQLRCYANCPVSRFGSVTIPSVRGSMRKLTCSIAIRVLAAPTSVPQTYRMPPCPRGSNGRLRLANTSCHTFGTRSLERLKRIGKMTNSNATTSNRNSDCETRFSASAKRPRHPHQRSTSICVRSHSKRRFSTSSLPSGKCRTSIGTSS